MAPPLATAFPIVQSETSRFSSGQRYKSFLPRIDSHHLGGHVHMTSTKFPVLDPLPLVQISIVLNPRNLPFCCPILANPPPPPLFRTSNVHGPLSILSMRERALRHNSFPKRMCSTSCSLPSRSLVLVMHGRHQRLSCIAAHLRIRSDERGEEKRRPRGFAFHRSLSVFLL